MNNVAKSDYFPHSIFGADTEYVEAKKKKVAEKFSELISQSGGEKKAKKYLEKVAENSQSVATGKDLVKAVVVETGSSVKNRIVERTGLNPGEFITDMYLDVLAEPEVTVSHNDKSGLTFTLKSQPGTKVKALEQLSKLAKLQEEEEGPPTGVGALSLAALLKLQTTLDRLERSADNPATKQGIQNDAVDTNIEPITDKQCS